MSFEGFTHNRSDQRPAGDGTTNGVKPQARDAWNQPIDEPITKPVAKPGEEVTNDDGINDDAIDSIWKDVKKEGSKPNDGVVTPPAPAVAAKEPAVQMREYLDSVGLQPIVITDADKEKFAAGDFTDFVANVNQKIQQAHVKAISGSKTLMESMVNDAVTKAVGESKNYVEGRASLEALHTALPFTKNPAIGPVAQTVMQRFMDKGATREQALEGVKRWSKTFVQAFDPNYQETNPNKNRNGNFSGSVNNEGNNGDADWISVLSGKG